MRRRMEEMARVFDCFDAIVWIDDLVRDVTLLTNVELGERKDLLRARVGAAEPIELWSGNPSAAQDGFVFDCYPRSKIILFEDGLWSYAAPWAEGSLVRRVAVTGRAICKWSAGDPRLGAYLLQRGIAVVGRPFRKPSAVYLVLARRLGVPRPYRGLTREVEPAMLRDVLRAVPPESTPERPPDSRRRRALVLSGSYSFWSAMSRDDEIDLYARVLRRLASAGYELWWKEHPRSLEPFLPAIRRRLPHLDVRSYGADGTLPIERALLLDPVELVVAGTSTSLLYVPLVSDGRIPVASFAEWVRPFVRDVRLRIVDMVQGSVPSLDSLIARRDRRDTERVSAPASAMPEPVSP
jgi:hypothetical protein